MTHNLIYLFVWTFSIIVKNIEFLNFCRIISNFDVFERKHLITLNFLVSELFFNNFGFKIEFPISDSEFRPYRISKKHSWRDTILLAQHIITRHLLKIHIHIFLLWCFFTNPYSVNFLKIINSRNYLWIILF